MLLHRRSYNDFQHLLWFCWFRWSRRFRSNFRIHVFWVLRTWVLLHRLSINFKREGNLIYWWCDRFRGTTGDWRSTRCNSQPKVWVFWYVWRYLVCRHRIGSDWWEREYSRYMMRVYIVETNRIIVIHLIAWKLLGPSILLIFNKEFPTSSTIITSAQLFQIL